MCANNKIRMSLLCDEILLHYRMYRLRIFYKLKHIPQSRTEQESYQINWIKYMLQWKINECKVTYQIMYAETFKSV